MPMQYRLKHDAFAAVITWDRIQQTDAALLFGIVIVDTEFTFTQIHTEINLIGGFVD